MTKWNVDTLLFCIQARDAEIAQRIAEESHRADEEQQRKLQERYEESRRYQSELEKQLEEQEQLKQEAYEEFLKEKLMIDEIVRKIHEEDARYVVAQVDWHLYGRN